MDEIFCIVGVGVLDDPCGIGFNNEESSSEYERFPYSPEAVAIIERILPGRRGRRPLQVQCTDGEW